MKIKSTNKIRKKIESYIEKDDVNFLIGSSLSAPVAMGAEFEDRAGIQKAAEDFKKEMNFHRLELSTDEAYMTIMLMSIMAESTELDDFEAEILNAIISNSKIFHEGFFEKNMFYRDLKFENKDLGNGYEVCIERLRKYQFFHYDQPIRTVEGYTIPSIGTFDYRFDFPCIKKNGGMTAMAGPSEVFSHIDALSKAHGKVLVLGCGMGYFSYMASISEKVDSVTVVDNCDEILNYFEENTLPQFENKDKVKVIHSDAYEFMENLEDGEYDYCFIEIWNSNSNSLPYFKMKDLCKKFTKTEIDYWIEDSIMNTVTGYILSIIMEENSKVDGSGVPKERKIPEEEKKKIEYLREMLKDAVIEKPEDVDYYMNYKNLLEMLA